MSDSSQPHGLQHTRLPCPSATPRACSNSCPLNQWCHPTISSSVVPFYSCLQSFPASGSFPMSQLFTSGGQSIGASASVLFMNIKDWFSLDIDWFGLLSIQETLLHIHTTVAAAAAKSLQSCLTLCDPRDDSTPGSAIPGILQARTLEWVASSFSSAGKWKVKEVIQSCPTLCTPVDCSLPGSSVHGIFQARVLEWGAIAFSYIHTTTIHKIDT